MIYCIKTNDFLNDKVIRIDSASFRMIIHELEHPDKEPKAFIFNNWDALFHRFLGEVKWGGLVEYITEEIYDEYLKKYFNDFKQAA
jgi:hypothetical protein